MVKNHLVKSFPLICNLQDPKNIKMTPKLDILVQSLAELQDSLGNPEEFGQFLDQFGNDINIRFNRTMFKYIRNEIPLSDRHWKPELWEKFNP